MSDVISRPTGFIPTPKGNPKFGAMTVSEMFDLARLKLIPVDQMEPFNYVRKEVPNLDQGQTSRCVPTTWIMVLWIWLVKLGVVPPGFSISWLYSWICNGVDDGSSPGDAITTLQVHGASPDDLVPPGILGPPGYNSIARAAALAWTLGPTIRVTSFIELVNAARMGLVGGMDVYAVYPDFTPDANGIVPVLDGNNNHEVLVGERFIRIDGQPLIRGRNPWGWPMWLTEEHVKRANEIDLATGANFPITAQGLPPALK